MKKQTRHERVLAAIQARGTDHVISTRELAESLNVSEMTVRRDLYELDQQGLIKRVHGGAVLVSSPALPRAEIGILRTSSEHKFADPFFSQVLEGADRKLRESGYRAAYILSYQEVPTWEDAHRLMQRYPTDAILLLGTEVSECIDYVKNHAPILVTVVTSLGPRYDAILLDGYHGIRSMVDHLVSLGRQRLAFVTGNTDDREEGFWCGVRAHHLPESRDLYVCPVTNDIKGWSYQMGQMGAAILMSKTPRPDAIVCASDRLAIGVMQWLHQQGIRVPDDIAVTGFDNIADSEFTIPPLTTVHVHKQLIGALGVERAIRRIEQPNEIPLQIKTPTSLLVRASCGSTLREKHW